MNKKLICSSVACFLGVAASAQAGLIYSDDFSADPLNATFWNDGGGFLLNTADETVLLSAFAGTFGKKGDGSGASGLNSTVGYATFSITDNGVNPLGGNFVVGNDNYANNAHALVRVTLATGGAGTYQVLWNNSATSQDFSVPGWAGTLTAGQTLWRVGTGAPVSGSATTAANVDPEDPANRVGFWVAHPAGEPVNAVIDDLEIHDNLDVIPAPPGPGAYVVHEDFEDAMLDPDVWTQGGGFFLNTAGQNVRLSTFGTGFGARGDGTGAAGLDSNIGYASFTVAQVGEVPLGGNFVAGYNAFANSNSGLVNVSFAAGGTGTYEILWNNSAVARDFTMPISGWTGTIGADSSVWIVNGDTANAVWGTPTSQANVSAGDPANRFSFWINDALEGAIIDNLRIADNLAPVDPVSTGPVLTITRSGSDVILSWDEPGYYLEFSEDLGQSLPWEFLDDQSPVTLSIGSGAEYFRLNNEGIPE